MKLPLRYNVQSLAQRKLRSLLTAGGVGLSIFMSVMMLALSRGLLSSTMGSGAPENLILLSKGAESLEFSAVETAYYNLLKGAAGIAKAEDGQPLLSPEAYLNSVMSVPGVAVEGEPRGVVRGVWPVAQQVHGQFKLTEGEFPGRGFQVAVGQLAATKLGVPEEALAIGKTLGFEGRDWTIVGRFTAPGSVLDSELWVNLDDVMVAARRDDYSTIVLRAESPAAAETLLTDLKLRTDVRVDPVSEASYYASMANQLKPVQAVAVAMTVILIAGGLMAGMNTMFTSILGRTREMGVLLVLGYKRKAVLLSFVLESVLLCLAGGILGVAAGLLLSGLPMKIPMGAFRFQVDTTTVALGLGLALLIGVLGALLPVLRVSGLKIVDSLRAN
jgi:putative ABC transport system permease protein